MSARQTIDEILLKFAHQIGLPALHLTENEVSLAFDDNLRVHIIFHPESTTLQLEAEIVGLQIVNSYFSIALSWPLIITGLSTSYFLV